MVLMEKIGWRGWREGLAGLFLVDGEFVHGGDEGEDEGEGRRELGLHADPLGIHVHPMGEVFGAVLLGF